MSKFESVKEFRYWVECWSTERMVEGEEDLYKLPNGESEGKAEVFFKNSCSHELEICEVEGVYKSKIMCLGYFMLS